MTFTEDQIWGLLSLGVPALLLGLLFLRRYIGVFLMFLAMVGVGLGYLTTTGAIGDIGSQVKAKAHEIAPSVVPVSAPAEPAPAAP